MAEECSPGVRGSIGGVSSSIGGVRGGASLRRVKVGRSSLFSREVLYTLFITNVLSIILGTGIG